MINNELSFKEIVLSKKELLTLKRMRKIADEPNEILVTLDDFLMLKRLAHWEFIEFYPNATELPDNVYCEPIPERVRISDRGRDYLAYLRKRKRDKTSNYLHEIIRTLFDALAGALAILLAEHFREIVDFVHALRL